MLPFWSLALLITMHLCSMERRSLGSRLLQFANAYYAGSKTSMWAELYNHVLLGQPFSAKKLPALSLYLLQWWKYHRHWDLSKSKQKKKRKERKQEKKKKKHKSFGLKGWISIPCCSQGDRMNNTFTPHSFHNTMSEIKSQPQTTEKNCISLSH